MTRKHRKPGPTPPRPWQPLQPAAPTPDAQATIDALEARGLGHLLERELWLNDRYTVGVRRNEAGQVHYLSIRRNDRKAARDWRHFQEIKNQLAGPDVEAVELYPAEARLVDTANQFWLWCLPPGERFPIGFEERMVTGEEPAWVQELNDSGAFDKAQQRPREDQTQ